MYRRIFAFFSVLAAMLSLAACSFSMDSISLGPLDDIFKKDPIVCSVLEKNGQELTLLVLASDGHYDVDDELLVSYSTISGGSSVKVGDTVTFSYDYLTDVTAKGKFPYIVVDSIEHTDFTPTEPPTEESTEEPTDEPTKESAPNTTVPPEETVSTEG